MVDGYDVVIFVNVVCLGVWGDFFFGVWGMMCWRFWFSSVGGFLVNMLVVDLRLIFYLVVIGVVGCLEGL